jgi:hypothetical protein
MPSSAPYTFQADYDEEFGSLSIHFATQADMDAYVWPQGVKTVMLNGDQVNHLHVPDGVESVFCAAQGLCTLRVPDSCIVLGANDNRLTELELPAGIEWVAAQNNHLGELRFRGGPPTALCRINLENNRLRRLDFVPPPTLHEIKLQGNGAFDYIAPEVLKVIKMNEECTI